MHSLVLGLILRCLIFTQLGVILGPVQPRTTPVMHGVHLNWTASATSGVTYNVYRATVSGGPYTKIANVPTLAYTDGGLPSSTTYYYVLTSQNLNGESSQTTEVSATTL